MTDHLDPDAADPGLDALAAGAVDTVDTAALALLRAEHERHDPVPHGLVDRVTFAISLDHLEAEVAQLHRLTGSELVARSAGDRVDEGDVTDRAGRAQRVHSVTFTSDTVTTMVTLTPLDGDGVRVDGWAAPGAGLQVELRLDEQRHDTVADEDGRFVFERVAHGLAQLLLRPADGQTGGRPVITPALEI